MNRIMGKWKATLYDDDTYRIDEVEKEYVTPGDECMCIRNGVFFMKDTREEVVKVLKQYIRKKMLELDTRLFNMVNLVDDIK